MKPRALAILFALGAVVLTLLDSIHVHTHTLEYVHPMFYGSAWWVPLLMGAGAAFGGYAYVTAWARLRGPTPLAPRSKIAIALFAFVVMYAASGLLPATHLTKLIVFTIAAFVIQREVDGTRVGMKLMLAGAAFGPIVEAINPGFHYLEPDYFGAPMWLPALYACAMPPLGQLARRLNAVTAATAPSHAAPAV